MSSRDVLIDGFLKARLQGKAIDGFTTDLAHVKRLRFIEERYFELYLKNKEGVRSTRPVIRGIYFAGRGWVKPWIEANYAPKLTFPITVREAPQVDISDTEAELTLFRLLSDMVSPGGKLMVEYSLKDHPDTVKALEDGAPPVLTKLGYLLWKSGFTSFKDWYFAEGWLEGNTKLQGEKPLDESARVRQINKLVVEVGEFLQSGRSAEGLIPEADTLYRELKAATA